MEEVFIKVTTRGSNIETIMCSTIQNVDMVIAWPVVGPLIRWSMQTQSESTNIVIRDLWVDSMTVLLACDQGCSMEPKRSTVPLADSSTSASGACRHMNR